MTTIVSRLRSRPPLAKMQRISRLRTFSHFDRTASPIAHVEPGETFLVETVPSSLVATGPIEVTGAVPGDALAITVHSICFGSEAAMWMKPGRGAFGSRLADTLRSQVTRTIPLRDGKAFFSEQIAIPLRPMIGVAGVAPWGDSLPTYWPGRHGGNLDCRLVTTGNTLYLPVAAPGALLGIGDLHAAMGDGEIMLSGVEAAGEVTLSARIVRPWRVDRALGGDANRACRAGIRPHHRPGLGGRARSDGRRSCRQGRA